MKGAIVAFPGRKQPAGVEVLLYNEMTDFFQYK